MALRNDGEWQRRVLKFPFSLPFLDIDLHLVICQSFGSTRLQTTISIRDPHEHYRAIYDQRTSQKTEARPRWKGGFRTPMNDARTFLESSNHSCDLLHSTIGRTSRRFVLQGGRLLDGGYRKELKRVSMFGRHGMHFQRQVSNKYVASQRMHRGPWNS